MPYNICKICSKFFEQNGSATCPECLKKDKLQYDKVRAYVETHRGATVLDVINATGIPFKTIMRFVEEGSLCYVNDRIDL